MSQVEAPLWAIVLPQMLFVILLIIFRVLALSIRSAKNYDDLLYRGEIKKVLDSTRKRLESHPNDVSAQFFRAKALQASGLSVSACKLLEQIKRHDMALAQNTSDWVAITSNGSIGKR